MLCNESGKRMLMVLMTGGSAIVAKTLERDGRNTPIPIYD